MIKFEEFVDANSRWLPDKYIYLFLADKNKYVEGYVSDMVRKYAYYNVVKFDYDCAIIIDSRR